MKRYLFIFILYHSILFLIFYFFFFFFQIRLIQIGKLRYVILDLQEQLTQKNIWLYVVLMNGWSVLLVFLYYTFYIFVNYFLYLYSRLLKLCLVKNMMKGQIFIVLGWFWQNLLGWNWNIQFFFIKLFLIVYIFIN